MLGFLKKLLGGGKSPSEAQESPADDVPCPSALEPDPEPDLPPEPMTTSERKATDIRRPGGHVPRGDELPPKETKQGSMMLDAGDPLMGRPSKPDVHWSERDLDDSPSATMPAGREDHLGKAAGAKHAAKQAIREKRFDDAWRLLHEQQSEWLSHANRQRFTQQQTLSLLSSINEDMANVLRLEGKHDEAMVHILYCVATNSRPTQAQRKKLGSYFRRCKFEDVSSSQVDDAVERLKSKPDFREAQVVVAGWRNGHE